MIYVGVMITSVMFAYLAEHTKPGQKQYVLLFSAICILIPSLLGGLRSSSIGTDVSYYIENNYIVANKYADFFNYINHIYSKEPLYLFIIFIIARCGGSFQVVLFTFQALIMTGVFIGAWRCRKHISVAFVLFLYFCFYYNDTFNTVRQHIAMSIVFLGGYNIFEKKYIRFSIYVLIATVIHMTAIVSLSFIVVDYIICNKDSMKRFRNELIIVLGSFSVIFGLETFTNILVNLGIIHKRYLTYFNKNITSSNNIETLVYLLELFVILLLGYKVVSKIYAAHYLRTNLFLSVILLQLSRFMYYGNRLSMYFSVFNILLIAQMPNMAKNKENVVKSYVIISALAILYWWYMYIYGGVSQTYPFAFFFSED